jgi:hypothetical protein
MSQQDYHHSPADSPLVHRPASQASHHLAPVATGHYSPALHSEAHHAPLTSFPGQFRPFTPSLTLPHTASYANGNSNAYPPPTAPPLSYFPTTSAPIYDARHGQTMMRTTSHAHPMYSEHTASTRYSPDPNSAGGLHHASPPSATLPVPNHYPMSSIQPTISVSDSQNQHQNQSRGHINPSLFNNNNDGGNYPMSRSTSGASASDAGHDMGRLLTPNYPYEAQLQGQGREYLSPIDEIPKVSDPMSAMGLGRNRLYPASYAPSYEQNGGHGLGLGPHPQLSELFFRGNPYGDHYAMSSARGDVKPDVSMMGHDTEYERERQQQIMENRRLFEDIGLGQQTVSPFI